ncbi:hypothetical protein QEJ31_09830 [Pigmentibacter sp. JX0631]|uniref:hypothetical protein n=1 Tax=Pigmentibacter sp. JX0631 TaxID=2976982 RepID=UPI00246830E0|nr:hypothetical protein [Pigmentibacter sp. JX0631]WGL58825.1 hypothetical protein QEJ31_09830 [Pigmentibacter sp. JX0631]
MLNQIQMKRQLLKSKDELEGFTLKNKSIFYEPNEQRSVNLSSEETLCGIHSQNDPFANQVFRWSSKEFDQLLNTRTIDLNSILKITDQDCSSKINLYQRLNYFCHLSFLSESVDHSPGLFLLGPFVEWKSPINNTNAPIFKIPVYLKKDGENRFIVVLKEKTFTFSKVLLYYLDYTFNIKINEEKTFTSANYALHYLIEKLRMSNIDIQFLKYKYDVKFEDEYLSSQFSIYDFIFLDVFEQDYLSIHQDFNHILKNYSENTFIKNIVNRINEKSDRNIEDYHAASFLDNINSNILPYQAEQNILQILQNIEINDIIRLESILGLDIERNLINILAFYMLEGKNILFVSENNKNLNDIYLQLSNLGLKNKLAKISSNTENKFDVYDNIFEQYTEVHGEINKEKFFDSLDFLKKTKFEINELTRILHEKHLKSGLANFEILHKVFFAKKELFDNNVYQKFGFIEWNKLASILDDINGIQYFYNRLNNNLDSPWRFKLTRTLKNKKIFDELQEIKSNINNLKGTKAYIEYKYSQFLRQHVLEENLSQYFIFLENFKDYFDISYDYRLLWENKVNFLIDLQSFKIEIIELLEEINTLKNSFSQIKEEPDIATVEEIIEYFSNLSPYTNWFNKKYWALKRKAKQIFPNWDGNIKIFLDYKNYLILCSKLEQHIQKIKYNVFSEPLNSEICFNKIQKICSELEKMHELFNSAKECISEEHFLELTESYYSYKNKIQLFRELDEIHKQVHECDENIESEWQKLSQFIQVEKVNLGSIEKKISFINVLIDRMDDIDFIHQYNNIINNLQDKYQLVNLDIEIIESLSNYQVQWKEVVYASVVIGWFNDILSYNPSLKLYGREYLENLSLEYLEANEYLKANLYNYYESHEQFPFKNIKEHKLYKQMLSKLLSRESATFNSEESKLFRSLKSCWLLTTNLVSKYLPYEHCMFDLVIVDLKDQTNLDKFIPAIFRGKKLIKLDYDSRLESNLLSTKKSFTEQSFTNKSSYNQLLKEQISLKLTAYLETKHEPLWTFLNHAFYSGELALSCRPLPILSTQNFEYIEIHYQVGKYHEECFFEINEIVQWLSEKILEQDSSSFVIVTVSLEQLLYYKEYFFEKLYFCIQKQISRINLRERIKIITIHEFQPTKYNTVIFVPGNVLQNGKLDYQAMLHPFKDVNIKKSLSSILALTGEKFVLFNPFPLYLIETNDSSYSENYNFCIWGRFLKYLKAMANQQFDKAFHILKSFKSTANEQLKASEFALFVKEKLIQEGYKVTEMYGYNNIFIDLVVYHPMIENEILLGIECDECISHSTQILTDKLVVRDKILIQEGWNLEKVYSVDWLKNPEFEFKRLLQVIQSLIDCFQIHRQQAAFPFAPNIEAQYQNNAEKEYSKLI